MWYVRHRHTLAAASPEPLILNFQTALDARAALMVRRHGLASDRRPVFIAIAIDDAVRDTVLDTIAYITWKRGFWGDAPPVIRAGDLFCVSAGAARKPGVLDLISFWPVSRGQS
ncbi:MAG: hypothetical protein WB677_22600 [Xanthobacteraceae bacterium]